MLCVHFRTILDHGISRIDSTNLIYIGWIPPITPCDLVTPYNYGHFLLRWWLAAYLVPCYHQAQCVFIVNLILKYKCQRDWNKNTIIFSPQNVFENVDILFPPQYVESHIQCVKTTVLTGFFLLTYITLFIYFLKKISTVKITSLVAFSDYCQRWW